ncbi:MAG: aldo/keto reductase [Thermoplasmata archaeon]
MTDMFLDDKATAIGLGTWQMGLKGWGKDYDYNSSIEAFKYAINNGINFIDTAEIYGGGKSEELIGKALETLDRKHIYIATKVAGFNATAKRVSKSLHGSLNRMHIDYVDLYQIHWEPSNYTNLQELFKELERLAKEGLIKHIGVSNFSLNTLQKVSAALKDYRIESNQIKFNLIERPDKNLQNYMNEHNIKLIAWSPLAQGFLTGKYGAGNKPSGGIRKINSLFSDRNMRRYEPLLKVLKEIASQNNVSVTQLVLAYEAHLTVLPIPGFKNVNQVKDIVGALNLELMEKDIARISEVIDKVGTIYANDVMFPRFFPNFMVRLVSLFL